MHRSRLRNKFLRERTKKSKVVYNKQRNICISFLRKTKKTILPTWTQKL